MANRRTGCRIGPILSNCNGVRFRVCCAGDDATARRVTMRLPISRASAGLGESGRVPEEDDSFTRWIEACAAGELLGIASAALWWVTCDRFDPAPVGLTAQILMLVAKGGSGLIQGVVLGLSPGLGAAAALSDAQRQSLDRRDDPDRHRGMDRGGLAVDLRIGERPGYAGAQPDADRAYRRRVRRPHRAVVRMRRRRWCCAASRTGRIGGSWPMHDRLGPGVAVHLYRLVGGQRAAGLARDRVSRPGGRRRLGRRAGHVTGLSFKLMPSRYPAPEPADPRF
jgi:hypothetical protein